mmetsp:Transcript_68392/g.132066  ORF Transcript_68392/g.132066 Transcript_68392/m.132066 type:complete len:88 (+) Transcript_68392:86-349(+)
MTLKQVLATLLVLMASMESVKGVPAVPDCELDPLECQTKGRMVFASSSSTGSAPAYEDDDENPAEAQSSFVQKRSKRHTIHTVEEDN